ncbi:MAG: glutaminyl-peptide cyclotransferase [Gammaproteobacteria bacterium]|nr:glutaminyl-peptide cyclotransferase [Gammaproteobacteria bacterium]
MRTAGRLAFLIFAAAFAAASARAAPSLAFRVVAERAHDSESFTQGLAVHGDTLIESAGGYGRSRVTLRRLADGALLREHALPADVFAEGLAVAGERVVQLTWQSQFGFLYGPDLRLLGRWSYRGEGWGLAFDGRRLIRSDGSDRLRFHDPHHLAETGGVAVRDGTRAVTRLNELEYADGWLYANVWLTDRIAVIQPDSGAVRAWLDLSDLKRRFAKPPRWNAAEHVLNGIAYDPRTRRFLVTGKCWPVMFELEIEPVTLTPAPPRPSS